MNGEACGAGQNLTVVACRFRGALLRKLKLKVLKFFLKVGSTPFVSLSIIIIIICNCTEFCASFFSISF